MSLSNALDFEMFNLKDMWKKIKKDPERLLVGAVDPWSTKMWNKVLGKDYEPMVDQMGGPYGGSTFSMFGNRDGGVYGRAKEAGIGTGTAGGIHDGAHVVAGLLAGNYGLDKLGSFGGNTGGTQGQQGWQQYTNMMPKNQSNQPIVDPAEEERKRKEEEARKRRAAALAASLRATGNQGMYG